MIQTKFIILFILFIALDSMGALDVYPHFNKFINYSKKFLGSTSLFISSLNPSFNVNRNVDLNDKSPKVFEKIIPRRIPKPVFFPPVERVEKTSSTSSSQFVRNAVRSVGPSVVRIDCEREISQLMSLFSDHLKEGDVVKVSGTGIIVSSDGYILTNAHVIDQSRKVTITLSNGRSFKAKVIASDEFTDLAVIKVDVAKENNCQLTKAPIGDSASLQAGDWVIAVGCPVGLDFTVTLGVVSSPRRSANEVGAPHLKGNYIQTDAALNSGNSGGPLVNDAGQVIGILIYNTYDNDRYYLGVNTMVRTNTEAIGFAIPINRASQIYEVLKTGNKPSHAYFGIEVLSMTPDNAKIHNEDPNAHKLPEVYGAVVMKVIPGSPADICGIRKNDIITQVNGNDVFNSDDADTTLDQCKPGKSAYVTVSRGENNEVVRLEAFPKDLYALIEERKRQHGPMFVIKPPA